MIDASWCTPRPTPPARLLVVNPCDEIVAGLELALVGELAAVCPTARENAQPRAEDADDEKADDELAVVGEDT